jgi:hypothetical protein
LSENLKGREHSEHLGVDRRIIFKRIFGERVGKVWIGFMWLRIGAIGGFL